MSKQVKDALYEMADYRDYIQSWARSRGRGEFKRISKALNIHTTLVSQICNGKKSLTEEQAAKLCEYMELNPLETDFFIKLVQFERSGNESLKRIYSRHLIEIQKMANEVRAQVPESTPLNDLDQAQFLKIHT